jgi:hypothetical protein
MSLLNSRQPRQVTRGQLAALIALRLSAVLDRAPKRPPSVATDIRTHWAAESIVRVTQAGVMDVSANHTFQPDANISRGELAIVSARLIPLVLADRSADLAPLKAARPPLGDVAESHALYRSAALAVASAAMKSDADGRFQAGEARDRIRRAFRCRAITTARGAVTR